MRQLATMLTLAILAACTTTEKPAKAGQLVVAVAGETVFLGRLRDHGFEGTWDMMSLDQHRTECVGRYRYDNYPWGTATFDCNDGRSGHIRLESNTTGFIGDGEGTSDYGVVHFVYGYTVDQANRRLPMPPGQYLEILGRGIILRGAPNAPSDRPDRSSP